MTYQEVKTADAYCFVKNFIENPKVDKIISDFAGMHWKMFITVGDFIHLLNISNKINRKSSALYHFDEYIEKYFKEYKDCCIIKLLTVYNKLSVKDLFTE